MLSLASHHPLLLSATTRANEQRPFAPNSSRLSSRGSLPRDRASCIRHYYERLRLRNRHPPPCRTDRLARRIEVEVCSGSSAPLSPLYLWLPCPTCLPRRPRRRWQRLTIIRAASIGLHPHTRDSATPVVLFIEAHLLWFIFIQAHRFDTRTAYSPRRLAGRQAPGCSVVNRLTRRVGLAPTSATTFTGCCGVIKSGPDSGTEIGRVVTVQASLRDAFLRFPVVPGAKAARLPSVVAPRLRLPTSNHTRQLLYHLPPLAFFHARS